MNTLFDTATAYNTGRTEAMQELMAEFWDMKAAKCWIDHIQKKLITEEMKNDTRNGY